MSLPIAFTFGITRLFQSISIKKVNTVFYCKTGGQNILEKGIEDIEVQGQLLKILASDNFRHSVTLTRFLQFIIDETLAGRGRELKEYTIALGVLAKRPDFNPQTDPIVRIHAGRLRRSLHEYYILEGKNDGLIITIPKGAYLPVFTRRGKEAFENLPQFGNDPLPYRKNVTIAVLPFSIIGAGPNTEFFADAIADHLSTELTRYPGLSVISYYSCRNIGKKVTDIKEAGLLLDAQFILTGTVQVLGPQFRIRAQLNLTESREQLWANSYERDGIAMQLFEVQDDIVWRVVSETAGHYGAISRNVAKMHPPSNQMDIGIYNAIFWYYHFVGDLSVEMFQKAENALFNAVSLEPGYALGWAVLGEIWVGGFFMGHQSRIEKKQLEQAVECGKRAMRIDPNCQHAYQTIALANIFLKNKGESLKAVEEWLRIKPGEAGIKGGMGFILICCGDYENGFKMLDESVQLNPYYQWWFNAGFAFYHFHKGDFWGALYLAEKMNRPDVAWELILKIASCNELSLTNEAHKYWERLTGGFPMVLANIDDYLGAVLRDEALLEKIKAAFLKAKP